MRAGYDSHDRIWPDEAADAGGRLQPGLGAGRCGADAAGRREDAEEPAADDAAAPDVNDPDILKDIDVSKLDWSQLNVDASPLDRPGAERRAPRRKPRPAPTRPGRRTTSANGTSAVSVKQSLSPFWDTRIGADMTVARQGTLTTSEPLSEKLANGGSAPQSSGTAWAAITAPGVGSIWDKTAVEARVDPGAGAEQARHLPEQVAAAQRAIFADPAERLQCDPAGHRAGARHRQPPGAQLRDRRSRRS